LISWRTIWRSTVQIKNYQIRTMIYHNLLVIFRNFKRNRSTFFINLLGLSTGLACVLLIYLWISDEWSMDKFHVHDAQLYQVMANHMESDRIRTIHETPDLLAETLAAEMPEVEMYTSYLPAEMIPMKFILSAQADQKLKSAGQFADKDFFRVFSYPLLQGNAAQVLQAPNSIVLSERMAKALFQSTENVIGKTVNWQLAEFNRQCVVTGVFKDLHANSSNNFDFVLTIQSFRDPTLFRRNIGWDNHAPSSILVLKKGTDVTAFDRKIAGFLQTKYADSKVTLFLQPYSNRYLHDQYEGGVQVGGRIAYIKLFGLIALFILLIACINFMNLSTARASLRMKEVGIKKAIGITRTGLAAQFMGESLVLTFLSLALASGWVFLLLPQFNTITGKAIQLQSGMDWVLPFVGIALLTGLVAGSYPALYLSGLKPIAMLKGKISRNAGEVWARKSLVVLQFSLSITFMIAVMVVFQQIQLVQTKNLGYNREQVIRFGREGKLGPGMEAFLSELKRLPGVVNAAGLSGNFLGDNSFTIGIEWPGKSAGETVRFANLSGTADLTETLSIAIKEGRALSGVSTADSTGLVFNEAAIAAMQLKNPIGQTVQLWGKPHHIVGVAKDFHIKSLREAVEPAFIRLASDRVTEMLVQLEAGKERETLARVQQFYSAFNPGYAFDYSFLDDDFQKQYIAENRVSALSRYFAGLAILLSCLGLFGLATFTAEQRTKEIGVRKVLGASVGSVVALLSKDFLKLVLLAIVIASPIAYYFMDQWLSDFAYRVELKGWVFVAAALAAVAVAFLTVGFQSLRAALMDPVDSLRSE
jgi:putative ABC transport system permease protein